MDSKRVIFIFDELDRRILKTMCSVPLEIAVPMLRGATTTWNGVAALVLCNVPLLVIRAQVGGAPSSQMSMSG